MHIKKKLLTVLLFPSELRLKKNMHTPPALMLLFPFVVYAPKKQKIYNLQILRLICIFLFGYPIVYVGVFKLNH